MTNHAASPKTLYCFIEPPTMGWNFCFWHARRDDLALFVRMIRPCGAAASDFGTKNSPQDCFLHVPHPLRVRVPSNTNKKHQPHGLVSFVSGAPEGTRTPDLLVRSQSLYPAELRAHSTRNYVTTLYYKCQVFFKKMRRYSPLVFYCKSCLHLV